MTSADGTSALGVAPDVPEIVQAHEAQIIDDTTPPTSELTTRDQWVAAVSRQDQAPVVMAKVHIDGPTNTMSHAFKIGAVDGQEYWIKTLGGVEPNQRPSLALEQVISRLGMLLGLAVVHPYLVRIPEGLKLPRMSNGREAEPGIAHATLAYASCTEQKAPPERRTEDDNKRRHVGVFALVDLARGSDLQYLYDASAENAIISHDHGLYVCNTGAMDVAAMIAAVSAPGVGCGDPAGLDAAEIERVADRLDLLTSAEVLSIVNLIPSAWPVTNEQLGTLGWFLHQRAKPVAARVRGYLP